MYKFAFMKQCVVFFGVFLAFFISLSAQEHSVLSEGEWYKISTNQDGIYRLTYSDFQSLGINVSNLQSSSIRIYGNGGGMLPRLNSDFRHLDLVENAIKVYDFNNNGFFDNTDYVLFYGMSPNVWRFNETNYLFEYEIHLFSNQVNYFLTIDNTSTAKRVTPKQLLQAPTKIINHYSAII